MRQVLSHVAALIAVLLVFTGVLAELHAQTTKPQARGASRTAQPSGKSTAIVNLNTASASELESLPGIGAKTAARIIEYRQKKGTFKKVEELMNVQGIGEKGFLKLKAQITVAGNAGAALPAAAR